MAEEVIGEDGHSGGDGRRPDARHRLRLLATTWCRPTPQAIELARLYLSYLPRCFRRHPLAVVGWVAAGPPGVRGDGPDDERRGYDMHTIVDGLLDEGSFFEIKPLFAPGAGRGFGRLEATASRSWPTTRP